MTFVASAERRGAGRNGTHPTSSPSASSRRTYSSTRSSGSRVDRRVSGDASEGRPPAWRRMPGRRAAALNVARAPPRPPPRPPPARRACPAASRALVGSPSRRGRRSGAPLSRQNSLGSSRGATRRAPRRRRSLGEADAGGIAHSDARSSEAASRSSARPVRRVKVVRPGVGLARRGGGVARGRDARRDAGQQTPCRRKSTARRSPASPGVAARGLSAMRDAAETARRSRRGTARRRRSRRAIGLATA